MNLAADQNCKNKLLNLLSKQACLHKI